MLCQSCGVKPATTHVKTIINGELCEYALCSDCAKKLGYADIFGDWGFNFGTLLGSALGRFGQAQTRCPFCGASFEDIAESGKVGCAECYRVFYDKLIPSIQRIHGNTTHNGKRPGTGAIVPRPEMTIQPADILTQKKHELDEAIKNQEFELAAKLRDEIKALRTD